MYAAVPSCGGTFFLNHNMCAAHHRMYVLLLRAIMHCEGRLMMLITRILICCTVVSSRYDGQIVDDI